MTIAQAMINRAMLTPYHEGHLFHGDGSLYMGRFTLWETEYCSARVHNIATADIDRVLHDHPWPFVSIVLRGGYTERLPYMDVPCWDVVYEFGPSGDLADEHLEEKTYAVRRNIGSVAFRKASRRHRISEVDPDTWTLFIYGKYVNKWGFYTPQGKMYWQHYLEHLPHLFSKDNGHGSK